MSALATWVLTAYCACSVCTGPYSGLNKTASGRAPVVGITVACPPDLRLGTLVRVTVPAWGTRVFRCDDRGSAIKGRRLDVFLGDHEAAKNFERVAARVEVLR